MLDPADLVPSQRVDAIVSGEDTGIGLAEELARLAPFGMGNPRPVLLMPAARLTDVRTMGEGKHVRFTVNAGAARASAVAFGRGRLPEGHEDGLDAAFSLEINRWNGAEEPRLVLRARRDARAGADHAARRARGRDRLAAALAELDVPLEPSVVLPGGPARRRPRPPRGRAGRHHRGARGDRRARARRGRRAPSGACAGCRRRVGGFALCSWDELERDPALADDWSHVVALDPPVLQAHERALQAAGPAGRPIWPGEPLSYASPRMSWNTTQPPGRRSWRSTPGARAVPEQPLDDVLFGDPDTPRTAGDAAGSCACSPNSHSSTWTAPPVRGGAAGRAHRARPVRGVPRRRRPPSGRAAHG